MIEPRPREDQANGMHRKPLGEILIETKVLTPEQLSIALQRQETLKSRHRYYLLGLVVVGLGFVNISQVYTALAIQQAGIKDSETDEVNHTKRETVTYNSREDQVTILSANDAGPQAESVISILNKLEERAGDGRVETMVPVSLGFQPLDDVLRGGIRAGELLLIGGVQGVGKTTMALQMARNIASSGAANCIYVCYEHNQETLLARLLAQESAQEPDNGILRGPSYEELVDWLAANRYVRQKENHEKSRNDGRVRAAMERLCEYGSRLFLLRGSSATTPIEAISHLVETQRRNNKKPLVLFVDYLQKIPVQPEHLGEDERIDNVAQGLKELAVSMNIPIVAIAATDRDGMKAGRVRAHHFWGGSALAYEADIILILADKHEAVARVHLEYSPQKLQSFRDWLICSVEKNRFGHSDVNLEFEKRFDYSCLNPQGRITAEKLIDDRLYTV